jgi:predicted RNA-binding protein associated with RNAse of E/G family
MENIKEELKDIVGSTMIPEVESYIEDLHQLLEEGKATDDDMSAIKEMESFLVELENIIFAIDEEKITDDQAHEVYEKIQKLIEESEEELV